MGTTGHHDGLGGGAHGVFPALFRILLNKRVLLLELTKEH